MATTNWLCPIIRALHCRSTHHFFAVDAIPLVQTDAGKRLVGHLLQHHRRYLAGTRDPDLRYRDFQNHVVHVTDGYWGGAPRVAHQWYDRLLRYLRDNRFSDAAHAAGVLSHYFTDPFQPLHTQLCQHSAVVHRPFEWAIQLAYEEVLALWRDDQMRVVFHLSDRPEWLGEAILHGARFANRKYQRIVDQYQLSRAIDTPDHGLTVELRESMAEVFGIVITGWARVLERTALDAEAVRACPLPAASVSSALIEALFRAPLARLQRHASFRRQRRSVEALCAEYAQTGRLQKHLPTEIDVVKRVIDVYHRERQWKQWRNEPVASLQPSSRSSEDHTSQSPDSREANPNRSAAVFPFAQNPDQNLNPKSEQASRNQPPSRKRAA